MIHLPAAIPKQLSGVSIHMKQRAVIIHPPAARALRWRSRLGELLAGTAAPTVRAALAMPRGAAQRPAAMAVLPDPPLLKERMCSPEGAGGGWEMAEHCESAWMH